MVCAHATSLWTLSVLWLFPFYDHSTAWWCWSKSSLDALHVVPLTSSSSFELMELLPGFDY